MRRSAILLLLASLLALMQPAAAGPRSLDVPRHVRFGKVAVGSQTEVFVTLTNVSSGQVRVSSIGVSTYDGGFRLDFDADGCIGTILEPGQSCSYGILFSPETSGRLTGQSDLVFLSADGGGFALIRLSGFGT